MCLCPCEGNRTRCLDCATIARRHLHTVVRDSMRGKVRLLHLRRCRQDITILQQFALCSDIDRGNRRCTKHGELRWEETDAQDMGYNEQDQQNNGYSHCRYYWYRRVFALPLHGLFCDTLPIPGGLRNAQPLGITYSGKRGHIMSAAWYPNWEGGFIWC